MMKLKCFFQIAISVYLVLSFYVLYRLLTRDKIIAKVNEVDVGLIRHGPNLPKGKKQKDVSDKILQNNGNILVEIWGKAAIGLYLWKHIFEAQLNNINGEFLKEGEMLLNGICFRFKSGPMITPETINPKIKNVILVINGREPKKINFAMTWLNAVKVLDYIENFAVVLLGNEQCRNEWLLPYMANRGGFVKFVFVVYDIPYIDDQVFFQWPLGVATYRNFPIIYNSYQLQTTKRKYICNFLGTVYGNSSRQKLSKIIMENPLIKENCFLHERHTWMSSESKETSELYQNVIKNSDLTLCPVGKNTECYRIYEAISYGSVPVIEDIMTPGKCGNSYAEKASSVPLRVLKRLNAPVIYVKNWEKLLEIVASEKKHSPEYIVQRRRKLLQWYQKFKYNLRNMFVNQVKKGFQLNAKR